MNIRVHFDFVSPYAYLAWTQIHALAERNGATVEPVPVLFAGLLGHHGTKGPAEVPARRAYLLKDIVRIAHRFGVPIAAPASLPFNPLVPLRAATLELEPTMRRALIDALYAATWVQPRRVDLPEVVAEVARSIGLDGDDILARASSAPVKSKLRANTEHAIAQGIFGVPTFLAGPAGDERELFWGTDSLPHLEAFLQGRDPAAQVTLGDFPATAHRSRE